MPPIRTLIAEDFEEFRQQLRRLLDEDRYVVVSEAADGLRAVELAGELQPDLVLLDLSLPNLNGMEAGRRIRRVSPASKIVVLSQESSPDIMRGALRMGALGYVLKSDAGELQEALEAVMNGVEFVSSRLRG